MTQACSKVLAHRRPLLALALVAALLAAAAVALSPARAANPEATTWSIGLQLVDADGDGVYQKGDTPRLRVTITASIQPDADDQSNGDVTDATVTGSDLMFHADTRLSISGGQGIAFQTDTNTQTNRLTGTAINAKADDFDCLDPTPSKSTGSSPAVATCTIDTLIDVSIPAVLEDKTYTISGTVKLQDASSATGAVTATWTDDKGPNTSTPDTTDRIRNNTGSTDKLNTGEHTNTSARVDFRIGVSNAIDDVILTEGTTCNDAGVVDADGDTNKACKTRIPVNQETEFNLAILNEASPPRGVVRGQIAAIVATLVRDGDGGGAATFSNCPNGTSGRASCSPVTTGTSDYNTTKATYRIKAPSTPGAATLRIQVLPTAGGTIPPETRELVFVGPAKTITLTEPTSNIINRNVDTDIPAGVGPRLAAVSKGADSITLTLSAVDARGNPAAHPTQGYIYEITGPDGRRINDETKIKVEQGQKGTTGTDATTAVSNRVLIDVTAPGTNPLVTGQYTVTVKRTAQKLAATQMFRVVGPAASLDLDVGDFSPTIGSQGAITATVNDAEGNPVPDGTAVTFTVSNADGTNNSLVILDGGSSDRTRTEMTEGGDGQVVVNGTVVGNGLAIVIATTSGASGNNISQPGQIDTTGGTQAGSSPLSSCLSKTDVGDYTSWTCSQTSTADAVFSVLRNRGADALWLRSVGTWIGYATTAAGAPIPRLVSNFIIRQHDILFIGG